MQFPRDDLAYYLIVYPHILTASGGDASLDPLVVSMKDYFNLAKGPLTPVFLGGPLAAQLQNMQDKITLVPFRPATKLSLEITYDKAKIFSTQHPSVGGFVRSDGTPSDPDIDRCMMLDGPSWATIGPASFITPRAKTVARLSPEDRDRLIAWMIGAIAKLYSREHAHQVPANPGDPERILYQAVTADPVLKATSASGSPDPSRTDLGQQWRSHLAGMSALTEDLYAKFLKVTELYGTPRYRVAKAQADDFLAAGQSERSHHDLVWQSFSEYLPLRNAEQELSKHLKLMFGSGELIRWDRKRADPASGDVLSARNSRLMVLDAHSSRLALAGVDGFSTNIVSLLGQVFRITALPDDADLDPAKLAVELSVDGTYPFATHPLAAGYSAATEAAFRTTEIPKEFARFHQDTRAPRSVRIDTAIPQADQDGYVWFKPKTFELRSFDTSDASASGSVDLSRWRSLPGGLLDVLTPAARVSLNALLPADDTPALLTTEPQRRGAFFTELYWGNRSFGGRKTPGTNSLYQARVRLARRPRTGLKKPIYEIVPAERLTETDLAFVETCIETAGRKVALWIPQKNAAPQEVAIRAANDISFRRDPSHPLPMLRILNDRELDAIDKALEKIPDDRVNDKDWIVDLAITDLADDDLFNGLNPAQAFGDPNRTLVAVNTAFESRVSRSADRLVTRVSTMFTPSPFNGDQARPGAAISFDTNLATAHFGNFTKVRLGLREGSDPVSLITYPDALQPIDIPKKPYPTPLDSPLTLKAAGPHWTYRADHVFTQELDPRTESAETPSGTNSETISAPPESLRYRFVTRPGGKFSLVGYSEHQCSIRVGHSGVSDITFPLSHDLRHVADLVATQQVDSTDTKKAALRVPYITCSFDEAAAHPGFSICLDDLYLTLALADTRNLDGTSGLKIPDEPSMEQLRAFYEALSDLRLARAAGGTLRAELWHFNSRVGNEQAAQQRGGGSVLGAMECFAVGTASIEALGSAFWAEIDALLPAEFSAFRKAIVDRARATTPKKFFAAVPADHFTWTDPRMKPAKPLPTPNVVAEANALRLALVLVRAPDTVIPAGYADKATFLPFDTQADTGCPTYIADKKTWSEAGQDWVSLAALAAKELKGILQPGQGPLFRSARWILAADRIKKTVTSRPLPAHSESSRFSLLTRRLREMLGLSEPVPAASPAETRESRLRATFADVAPVLEIPEGLTARFPRVADIFYVVHGLLPLVPINDGGAFDLDAITTFEFTKFVIEHLQAVLDGLPPPVVPLAAPYPTPEGADAVRTDLLSLTKGPASIGARISKLVRRVERVQETGGTTTGEFPYPEPGTDDKIRPKERALFIEASANLSTVEAEFRKNLEDRFNDRPRLFNTLRGIGLVIFRTGTDKASADSTRISDSIHTLRLTKRIGEDLPEEVDPSSKKPPTRDQHTFDFSLMPLASTGVRYFLDLLGEDIYHAQFTIAGNYYARKGAVARHDEMTDAGRDLVGAPVTLDDAIGRSNNWLVYRGDAYARTLSEVLEPELEAVDAYHDLSIRAWQNTIPPNVITARRSVEVGVIHYNPSWRRAQPVMPGPVERVAAWEYLLPSRRPPGQPNSVTVRGQKGDASRLPIFYSNDAHLPNSPYDLGRFQSELQKAIATAGPLEIAAASGSEARPILDIRASRAISGFRDEWWRLDTYLACHYFIVDADDATAAAPFQNDGLIIESEAIDYQEPSTPKPFARKPCITPGSPEDILFRHFQRDRLSQLLHDPASLPPIPPMKLTELASAIKGWVGRTGEFLEPDPHQSAGQSGRVFRYDPINQILKSLRPKTYTYQVGDPVVCDAFLEQDQLANSSITRYVVRVMVLESPWQRTRVRLNVQRNYRDIDGDGVGGIDERFRMESPTSLWSEIRQPRLDYDGENLRAVDAPLAACQARTSVPVGAWRAGTINLGNVLKDMFDAQAGNPSVRLWDPNLETADFDFFGMLVQKRTDNFAYAAPDKIIRDEELSIMPLRGTSGASLGTLTANVPYDKIHTDVGLHLLIRIVEKRSQREVMTLRLPLVFADRI